MRRIIAFQLAALSIAVAPSSAWASDANAGRELALKWCAACHLVAADQTPAPTVAPPFATIGKTTEFSAQQLAKSMLAPHPQMPGRELSREQASDLAAYIASLAK